MLSVLKYIVKYVSLFVGLYICSVIVINMLVIAGVTFENISNIAFIATLAAIIFLHLIKYRISGKRKYL